MISLQLAKILDDVPFVFEIKDCDVTNIDIEEFKHSLEKNEFHTLPKRVDEIFGKDGKFNKNGKGQMKLI